MITTIWNLIQVYDFSEGGRISLTLEPDMYTVDGLFPTQRRIRDQVISYLVLVLALASLIAEIYKIINADEVVNKTKKASKQMMEELVAHQ